MSEPSGIMVTVRHVRAAMLCTRGMREWLQQNGFDVAAFVRDGLPVETLEATGDVFALRVAALARQEAENDGR